METRQEFCPKHFQPLEDMFTGEVNPDGSWEKIRACIWDHYMQPAYEGPDQYVCRTPNGAFIRHEEHFSRYKTFLGLKLAEVYTCFRCGYERSY